MTQHLISDMEACFRVGAQDLLQPGNLFATELRTVNAAGVRFGRRRPADDGTQANDRWAAGFGLGRANRGIQLSQILHVVSGLNPVHTLCVPAVSLVTLEHVFVEGNIGVVFDGDLVVVIDHHKVAQLLMSGQRGSLGGDTFLQVAVGGNDVDGVVKDASASRRLSIEQTTHAALGVSEAHGGSQTLTQWAGSDLHPVGVTIFRVTWSLGVPSA